MRHRVAGLFVFAIVIIGTMCAQVVGGEQLGVHDLTPTSNSPVRGAINNACLYCHAPHGATPYPTPLWNQQLSVQTYNFYTSTTYHQTGVQPGLNSPSKLCLSCHDGTVAPGQTVAYGPIGLSAPMSKSSILMPDVATSLKASHPFSLKTPLTDSPNITQLLVGAPPRTTDPKVKLYNDTVECTTCHEPHFQNIDPNLPMFLVRDSSSSQLCIACHDPNRTINGQGNQLAGWAASMHSKAPNTVANKPYVGGYGTLAANGCNSCHMTHNAVGQARLLRGAEENACASCHSGTNTTPVAPNVFSEYAKSGASGSYGDFGTAHPFADTITNTHDPSEPVLMTAANNRHAVCADCHNVHAAQQTAVYPATPGVRPSQTSVGGVSATDGTTLINPYAVNQYENCFRCHATSPGKYSRTDLKFGPLPNRAVAPADPYNVQAQFASSVPTISNHPVTHTSSSGRPQPSLLTAMLLTNGQTSSRSLAQPAQLLCTDCHNSDDNKEFGPQGAAGPNGPHGSSHIHILERQYVISVATTPGLSVGNPITNPDLSYSGPYALCAKCHDLTNVMSNQTFTLHSEHVVTQGMSCSACHTAHGMGNTTGDFSGERLVNFDRNVVAPNTNNVLSYSRPARSCNLQCHNKNHINATY